MRGEPPTIRQRLDPVACQWHDLAAFCSCDETRLRDLVERAPGLYSLRNIPKKSGGTRVIRPPAPVLRDIQRLVLDRICTMIRFPQWMIGGVPGRSVFEHAQPHVGKCVVATLDIKSFFPSTTGAMIQQALAALGFGGQALRALLRLTCLDDQLPQGAPTSCLLGNLVLDGQIDRRIHAIARKHGIAFTRYVDDIALSGDHKTAGIAGAAKDIILETGFGVSPEKFHVHKQGEQQIVCNLVVNDKLRPTAEFINEVDELIWLCLEFGAEIVAADTGVKVLALKSRLNGKVNHIEHANAKLGRKLRRRLYGIQWH